MFEDTRFADFRASTMTDILSAEDKVARAKLIASDARGRLSQCTYGGNDPVNEGRLSAAESFLSSLEPAPSFVDTCEFGRDSLLRRPDVQWTECDAGIEQEAIDAFVATLTAKQWTVSNVRQGRLTASFKDRPAGAPVIAYTITTGIGMTGSRVGISSR